MAFERRTGVFMLQKSQQIVTMILYCPVKECLKPTYSKQQLEEHMNDAHEFKRFKASITLCHI